MKLKVPALNILGVIQEIAFNYILHCTQRFPIIIEETIRILGNNQRILERVTFRFDGLLVLCKPIASAFTGSNSNFYYHVKDKIFLKRAFISDIPDAEDLNYAFQIKAEDKIFTIMSEYDILSNTIGMVIRTGKNLFIIFS